jgi:hypothetical protein
MNDTMSAVIARLTDFPVATYCEHAFLRHPDQPFNVYSNLAFLLAAIMVVLLRGNLPSRSSWVIALLLLAVGGAGAWWHATMLPIAHAADLAASGALALVMAFLVIRYIFYWPLWLCAPALPLLYILCMGLPLYSEMWIAPGSVPILPAATLLALGGVWSAVARRSNAGLYLLMASFWMAGGFVLLSIDQPGCGIIHIGTHFGWHLLAAATVLTLARAVAGADIELLDFGRDDGDVPPIMPPPSNENDLTPEELENTLSACPPIVSIRAIFKKSF